jgi:hypothetical protein
LICFVLFGFVLFCFLVALVLLWFCFGFALVLLCFCYGFALVWLCFGLLCFALFCFVLFICLFVCFLFTTTSGLPTEYPNMRPSRDSDSSHVCLNVSLGTDPLESNLLHINPRRIHCHPTKKSLPSNVQEEAIVFAPAARDCG